MATELISRSEARARGLSKYFTGEPCKRGHVSERYVGGCCVVCSSEHRKRWVKENPDYHREHNKQYYPKNRDRYLANKRKWSLKSNYGLTEEDYANLLEVQDGCCAICNSDSPGDRWNYFHVDHDHKTGTVRGLLCAKCNTAIGLLSEDPQVLLRALTYLSGDGQSAWIL